LLNHNLLPNFQFVQQDGNLCAKLLENALDFFFGNRYRPSGTVFVVIVRNVWDIIMKYGKMFFRVAVQITILAVILSSLTVGCKNRGNGQPSNPFAMNRQTAPPPATFSHQTQYLGQTPNGYVPQLPVTPYPSGTGTTLPNTIPTSIPLMDGQGTPGATTPNTNSSYGSIGATLFQTSAVNSAPNVPVASENDWTADDHAATSAEIPATRETVFQNLESKSGSISVTDPNGVVKTIAEPETFAISSSQMVTQVIGDSPESPPEAASAQPQSAYAGKYQ
jgi:hypothetical protein